MDPTGSGMKRTAPQMLQVQLQQERVPDKPKRRAIKVQELGAIIGLLKSVEGMCMDEEPYVEIMAAIGSVISELYNLRKRLAVP